MEFRTTWDPTPGASPLPPVLPFPPKRRGRRPATRKAAVAVPPWLCHHLTISGQAEAVAQLRPRWPGLRSVLQPRPLD